MAHRFLKTGAVARAMMLSGVITASQPALAQVAQLELNAILHEMKPNEIALRRSACAIGHAPKLTADTRAAGIEWPDASAWCVTVMTRQGRDRTLGYVRDPNSNQPTPAISFDSGFVGGYLKREAVPTGAPSMATLLPIAERCLEQRQADNSLCSAAGQILGLRASHGEIVILR